MCQYRLKALKKSSKLMGIAIKLDYFSIFLGDCCRIVCRVFVLLQQKNNKGFGNYNEKTYFICDNPTGLLIGQQH